MIKFYEYKSFYLPINKNKHLQKCIIDIQKKNKYQNIKFNIFMTNFYENSIQMSKEIFLIINSITSN